MSLKEKLIKLKSADDLATVIESLSDNDKILWDNQELLREKMEEIDHALSKLFELIATGMMSDDDDRPDLSDMH